MTQDGDLKLRFTLNFKIKTQEVLSIVLIVRLRGLVCGENSGPKLARLRVRRGLSERPIPAERVNSGHLPLLHLLHLANLLLYLCELNIDFLNRVL